MVTQIRTAGVSEEVFKGIWTISIGEEVSTVRVFRNWIRTGISRVGSRTPSSTSVFKENVNSEDYEGIFLENSLFNWKGRMNSEVFTWDRVLRRSVTTLTGEITVRGTKRTSKEGVRRICINDFLVSSPLYSGGVINMDTKSQKRGRIRVRAPGKNTDSLYFKVHTDWGIIKNEGTRTRSATVQNGF